MHFNVRNKEKGLLFDAIAETVRWIRITKKNFIDTISSLNINFMFFLQLNLQNYSQKVRNRYRISTSTTKYALIHETIGWL